MEIYGNTTYPASRKMYSRPYGNGSWGPTGPKEVDDLADFRRALLNIGEDFIGRPFNFSCDVDRFPAHYFHPHFVDEKVVDTFAFERGDTLVPTKGYKNYRDWLPEQSRTALDEVASQIANYRRSEQRREVPYSNTIVTHTKPYDMSKLRTAFKDLWQGDIFIDARIQHAEELFFCHTDSILSQRFQHHGADSLMGNLAWMAEPENAERIAFMFLYSRVSQHYGERNEYSFKVAQRVARNIEQGREDTALMFPLVSVGLLGPRIKKRSALRKSTPSMIEDYKRLRDGSWAKLKIAEIYMSERPKMEAAPQLEKLRA